LSVTPRRCEDYLDFIRGLPCLYCKCRPGEGQVVQAHHEGKRLAGGGIGIKGCDFDTVPLCPIHHGEYHQRGQIGFWTREQTLAKFTRAIERNQALWQRRT
jgi:hypothetical protein